MTLDDVNGIIASFFPFLFLFLFLIVVIPKIIKILNKTKLSFEELNNKKRNYGSDIFDGLTEFSRKDALIFGLSILVCLSSFVARIVFSVPNDPGGLFEQAWIIFIGLAGSLAIFQLPRKFHFLFPVFLLAVCVLSYASLWYSPQCFLLPITLLFFVAVLFSIFYSSTRKIQKISKTTNLSALMFLSVVLFLFSIWSLSYSFYGIKTIEKFRKLDGNSVKEVVFYDIIKMHQIKQNEDMYDFLIDDQETISLITNSFSETMPYSPNHEGPPAAYLVCLKQKNGEELWFVLGQGNRIDSETAWIGFYSDMFQGSHYGVYQNKELYEVLSSMSRLEKWESNAKS